MKVYFDAKYRPIPQRTGLNVAESTEVRLGELSLRYWHAQYPGAFWLRVRSSGRGRKMRVEVLRSDNIRAQFKIRQSGLQFFLDLGLPEAYVRELLDPEFEQFFDLRIDRSERSRVPRPDGARSVSRRYAGNAAVRLEQLPASDMGSTIASAAIGAVPVLGDAYDLGEAAYALARGRDAVTGERLNAWDYILIGVGLLPVIPGDARRLRSAGRQALDSIGAVRSSMRRQLRSISDRLRRAVLGIPTDSPLHSIVDLIEARQAVSVGRVRDEALARQVVEEQRP
jgi:hypothetical protein